MSGVEAMTLYLLRHGVAEPRWSGADDRRPLSRDGVEAMRREARAMSVLGVKVAAVVTSPLARARETAAIVAGALGDGVRVVVDDRLAPGFGPESLAAILSGQGAAGDLLLVGHQPDLGRTIGELGGGTRVVMKPGGLARLDRAGPDDARWELAWLLPPDVLTM